MKAFPIIVFLFSLLLIPLGGCNLQQNAPPRVGLEVIAEGFISRVALVDPNDGSQRLFVVDQTGLIWILSEGKPGYVHYTGRLNGEKLQTVDQWQTLSLSADKAFRSLMTANNINLQSALIAAPVAEAQAEKEPAVEAPAVEPVAAPVVTPAPAQIAYLIPAVLAAILLFVGGPSVIQLHKELKL